MANSHTNQSVADALEDAAPMGSSADCAAEDAAAADAVVLEEQIEANWSPELTARVRYEQLRWDHE